MPKLIYKLIAREWTARLPLSFRVLYRQFLLRVIDFEALSIHADVVGFLGQFAGVLIMLSFIHSLVMYVGLIVQTTPAGRLAFLWHVEHYLITTMMLVIGLITVVSWDATFPDRRDVMVLSPLPVAPRTIIFAKVSAAAAVQALAVLTLNCASGILLPMLLGVQPGPAWGFYQSFPAWWFTIVAASAFLYCSILTVQGLMALLLPRRVFLRLSAILQLAAFGFFLGVFFLQPVLTNPGALVNAANHWVLAWSPSYWFFALFNQLNGSLPAGCAWIASRAWIGLGVAIPGAGASLLLCYVRTMKKTVEQPDLVPGAMGLHWTPQLGNSLRTAIAFFSIRSITRSRQHRVAFAFFLAFVFGLALSLLRSDLALVAHAPVPTDFIVSTFLMMVFAIVGLRTVFALPISLTANWVLRTTQVCPSERYIAATRGSLFLFGVAPVWLIASALAFPFRPVGQVVAHLLILAFFGWILAELCLFGFYKVPFTCSYLPGKSNIQLVFWAFFIVGLPLVISIAGFERRAFGNPLHFAGLATGFAAAGAGLFAFNTHRAKPAVIYFEELPEEVITTLRLST